MFALGILLLKSCLRGYKVSPDGFLQVWMKNSKDKPRLWSSLHGTLYPAAGGLTIRIFRLRAGMGGMFNQNFFFYNAASDGPWRDAPEPSRWPCCYMRKGNRGCGEVLITWVNGGNNGDKAVTIHRQQEERPV